MMKLVGCKRILTLCLTIVTQYQCVRQTERQIDGQTSSYSTYRNQAGKMV